MSNIKLTNRIVLGIGVKVLTGLHIGGSKEYYGIGGIDNPVIKNPLNGQPIIPGSSLKGKIRSLLVLSGHEDLRLFEPDSIGPSRAIFRDMKLSEDSVTFLNENLGFGVFTEAKTENKIEEFKGTANPRIIERVPAGVVFEGEIIINSFNNENFDELKADLKRGFELLELNYLGGSGTRGYGKVKVEIVSERVL